MQDDEDSELMGAGVDLAMSLSGVLVIVVFFALAQFSASNARRAHSAEPPSIDPKEFARVQDEVSALQHALQGARWQRANAETRIARARRDIFDLRSANGQLQATVISGEQQRQLLRQQIKEKEDRASQAQPPQARPARPSIPDQDRVVLMPSRGKSPYAQNGYDLTDFGVSALVSGLQSKRKEFEDLGANTLLIEGFASAEPDRATDVKSMWNLPAYRVFECNRESIQQVKDCREYFSFDRNLDLAFRRAQVVWAYLVFQRAMPRWCLTIVTHGRNRSRTLESQVGRLASEAQIRAWDLRWPDYTGSGTQTTQTPLIPPDDSRLSEERKVEIRAIFDPNSLCKAADLATALDRL